MLNEDLIQCPCVRVCHAEILKDGYHKFGGGGIVKTNDGRSSIMCSGCYIMENNLIPLVAKCHDNHTTYPKDSLLHLMNTYSYALHLWTMGQDTEEEDDTEDDDD